MTCSDLGFTEITLPLCEGKVTVAQDWEIAQSKREEVRGLDRVVRVDMEQSGCI